MSGQQHIEPICVRINDAARMIGVGRTKLYELISSGELEAVKIGKATRVTTASLNELVKRRSATDLGCR
ncbi:helix-turn-helix domain-containing protein [Pelagerythrobacter aerophilus]|jgi:excisionase family DNA binding protein|uniref:DNA-binding protein n=1 Tax=Pelagerythrobacter aerophilus TaxID=2306995 RepID=A0A418NLL5_9SPHN|nr:helix-turn-helix domain-containing protein [Pelagerythrobacter aerophilus]MEC7819164.1 helix-turn-helix domain-containing protein [Pseudomonadota bacterium]RIV80529.1 DNA-binding protein [Pelagerythrobacter aerophilus]